MNRTLHVLCALAVVCAATGSGVAPAHAREKAEDGEEKMTAKEKREARKAEREAKKEEKAEAKEEAAKEEPAKDEPAEEPAPADQGPRSARGGGLKITLPEGWSKAPSASGLKVKDGDGGVVILRYVDAKGAASPVDFLKEYVDRVKDAEGRKAVDVPVSGQKYGEATGATVRLNGPGDQAADHEQRVSVLPSKKADTFIIAVCDVSGGRFRPYNKTFNDILDSVSEE